MKRIIALVTALLLLSNLFVFTVSAAEVNITSVVYPTDKTSYAVGDTVKITGICTTGKDIVIRIYNEKDSLIFTDVILAPDNTTGTFEFTGFTIPSTSSQGLLNYKVVVSEEQDDAETTNIDTETMAINIPTGGSSGGSSGGGGGGTTTTMTSWVNHSKNEKEEDKDLTADKDPLNPDNQNDKLWDKVNNVKNYKEAEKAITDITKQTSEEDLKDENARNNVATAAETMIANIGAKTVKVSSSNKLSLSSSTITSNDLSKLDNTMAVVEKAIKNNKITLNRSLAKELVLNVKFDNKSKASVAISKDLVDKLVAAKVDLLTLKDSDFSMSYTITDLTEMLGVKEEITFELDKSGLTGKTRKIAVNFDTDRTQIVKIAFTGLKEDTKYMAIVDENGNPVGGRYNPATGVVEAKINASGVYQVVNNEKDFNDIKDKSREMQESIKILASKGIIEGTSETEFSPDDSISRAEIAALLLRVLSRDDPNADGGFADVKKSDWFYGTAGSSKNYGMIMGFEDNTFRGNAVIAKDQILTISSRVLKKEMSYKTPTNIAEYLTYVDADQIADWAKEDIALATMANIVTRSENNKIESTENMTRGEAALIIMRLFYKIW